MLRGAMLSQELPESLGGLEGNVVADSRYLEGWHGERGDVCSGWPKRENRSQWVVTSRWQDLETTSGRRF